MTLQIYSLPETLELLIIISLPPIRCGFRRELRSQPAVEVIEELLQSEKSIL